MQTILIVHSSSSISGGEVISLNIYKKLKEFFAFHFFIPSSKKTSNIEVKDAPLFFSKKNNIFSIIKSFKEVVKKTNPKIIHTHGLRAAFIVKLFLFFNKKKFIFIYTIHGFHLAHKRGFKNKIIKIFEKVTNYLFADKIICVGKDEYSLIKKISINKDKVAIISNGIDEPGKVSDEEIENFCKNYDYNLITVCRLHYQKDVETLIAAVKELPKNISLTIIGSGPLEFQLKELAKGYQNILFTHKDRASNLLHYFDIFILSTNWEGLPLVILESMLAKIPIIGSDVHGVKELLENNNGLLFQHRNIQDLKNKIIWLMENKDKKTEIINRAYNNALSNYSIDQMTEKYKELYQNYENPPN
jgi:glycosyltransferase involved in cell wall biosynthesis